jgi:hypothetical protein
MPKEFIVVVGARQHGFKKLAAAATGDAKAQSASDKYRASQWWVFKGWASWW